MVLTGRDWTPPDGVEHALVELTAYDGSHTHHWRRAYDGVLCVAPIHLAAPLMAFLPEPDGLRAVFLSSNNAALLDVSADYEAIRAGESAVQGGPLDAVILQPTAICGRPGDPVLSHMADRIGDGRAVWLPGARTRQWPVDFRDVADAMIYALRPEVPAGTYGLGGPQGLSYAALAREVECALWQPAVLRDVPAPAARALGKLLPRGREGAALRRAGVDRVAVSTPMPGFAPRRGIADMLLGLTTADRLPS